MSFITSSISNPCPICGDTKHKCRHHHEDGKHLCMTFADSRKGDVISGYKCTGSTKDGTWAMFALDNSQEWTEEQRRQWQKQREQRQREQQAEESEKIKAALSLKERDKEYREILASLTLAPEDRSDLKRRGFSDLEIDLCGIKSVKRYQELQKEFSHLLPGVSLDGKFILTNEGYLLPVRNADNLIVACQVRLKTIGSEGRYRWLSSRTKTNPQGQTPHIYGNGFAELPLSVHRPQGEPTGIALAEGVGVKAFRTSQRLNLLVCGAAGGQWASSPNLFKETLERLSTELGIIGTKNITIFPDAGDILNPQVMRRWREVCSLLDNWGWSVTVGWWGQFTKEDDDIDELDDTSRIAYISPQDFWSLTEEHTDKKSDEQASTKNTLTADWAKEQWLRSRKFTPDIKVNQDKFKFPKIPDSNVIVAIKSGLGTGKTEALLALIKACNRGSHIIGYRNNLLFQTINRGGKIHIAIYHLRQDDGHNLVADKLTHQAFCLDSIQHVDGYFAGRDIYLDETCSVLLHAVNGGTLGDEQAKVIKIFTRALQVCNRVILLDGNLSDLYVDFIAKLAPEKRVVKIENQYKIPPHDIKFIEGIDIDGEIKKRDKSALFKALFNDGVVPWIASDSKELTKVIDKLLKQSGKVGYVLNAETAGEAWAKEFLVDPDKFIEERKPQYFIISPTAESGVSVTIKNYFTDKFTFFVGVQGTNSQHQMMFRLRDNTISHYVFCPERSTVSDRSRPLNYSVNAYKRAVEDRISNSAILASIGSDNPKEVLDVIANAISRNNDDWCFFSYQLGALDNFEMDNLRKCLIDALNEVGHHVETEQWDVDEEFKLKEKIAKESVQKEHAQELLAAIEYDSLESAKQIAKSSPRKETQRRIEKTYLLDRIPGIQETDVWNADFIYRCYIKDRDFITKQQRYWLLNNFDVSQKRHEVDWFYKATNENFFSASMKRTSHLVIYSLKELGILGLIGKSFHKDSPEVIEIIEKARTRDDIKLALGIEPLQAKVDGSERITFISTLLAMIGLKKRLWGKPLINGVQVRLYEIDDDDMQSPERLAVLASVEQKFTKWTQSDKSVVNWEPVVEVVTPLTVEPVIESTSSLEMAVAQLEAVKSWDEVALNQDELDKAWSLLSLEQQKRLEQLYEQWQQWQKPESITDLAEWLQGCEDSETLALFRRCKIPGNAFKAASKLLPQEKRQQLREWVVSQNASAA